MHKISLIKSKAGLSLVELMITVAIIGVLAALGGLAYTRQVKQGKIAQVKQHVLDFSRAQEEYRARNNIYFNPSTSQYDGSTQFTHVLGVEPKVDNLDIQLYTEAAAGGTCNICPTGIEPSGVAGNTWWYLVKGRSGDIEIVMHSDTPEPIITSE